MGGREGIARIFIFGLYLSPKYKPTIKHLSKHILLALINSIQFYTTNDTIIFLKHRTLTI